MNWSAILVLVGVVGFLITAFAVKKKATRLWSQGILGVVAILGVLAIVGVGGLAGLNTPATFGGVTLAVPEQTTQNAPVPQNQVCPEVSKTVTISGVDAYTSVAVGGTHRYRINSNPAQTVSDAGTLTASPGDKIQVLYMNGSDGQNYFGDVLNYEVPCYGSAIASKTLYKNGTLTFDVYNRNGDIINGNAINQTMVAGDVFSLPTRLTGSYQRGYPFGGVIVAEYNSSQFDDVVVQLGGSSVPTPAWYTVSALDSVTKAYSVPALLTNGELNGQVVIDADDTNNPDTDVNLRFYPYNYFIDDKNGGAFVLGIQDENGARVFGHTTLSSIDTD